ncbi:DUF305 domain-containing protein [Tabrizicola sp. J26]|uniref:DUF305 domain-containing protein n=1 Tax=Alitabrizicola rongguiensis TaxID=2909234 RepID=UPI001F2E9B25|nr:DUF305 domain-containing protein [Tabrizicola rongguiensis]MCF1709341.1 DUF305 domain-containing protein [Tabrizicola rongguiensis]
MVRITLRSLCPAITGLMVASAANPAAAHVKWFAPYIVGAAPRPVSSTLADPYFWSGIAIALAFFTATRLIEALGYGERPTRVLNSVTEPLWWRLDDFIRATIAAFFIAIFAVGGIYLTPDLKTDSGLVSWVQLAIAVGVFFRVTMPLSALGVIWLWLLALRDYDLFHLLDYLALGLGVAGYLVLASARNPDLRRYRFDLLRWAVAISLMWSSLEKFAYPEWFYPLVVEKPFLTFGLPRDAFIPMAGVAEFTLGFGLLSTRLIRRLSAIALLVIFTAAVFPFGRVDLIGHGLIMAALIVIAVDRGQEPGRQPGPARVLVKIPASMAASLLVFAGAYWGTHDMIYDRAPSEVAGYPATHSPDPDHPHPKGITVSDHSESELAARPGDESAILR